MSDPRSRRAAARSEAATPREPERDLSESPLAWLARRKDKDGRPMLSDAEFDAGEKLRADFWFAQMTPRVTANWSMLLSAGCGQRGAPDLGPDVRDFSHCGAPAHPARTVSRRPRPRRRPDRCLLSFEGTRNGRLSPANHARRSLIRSRASPGHPTECASPSRQDRSSAAASDAPEDRTRKKYLQRRSL